MQRAKNNPLVLFCKHADASFLLYPRLLGMHYCKYVAISDHYTSFCLVNPLERWNGLAFVLIQCRPSNLPVAQFDFAMRLLLETESVLHPVFVVSLGVIFTGMSTAGFLPVRGSYSGLRTKKD